MGMMNDPVHADGPALVKDGTLRRVEVRAVVGTSRAQVALLTDGQEHFLWVQALCGLSADSVGRIGIMAAAPAASGYILLGLLDASDSYAASSPTPTVVLSDLDALPAVSVAPQPSIFSIEGDVLVVQHGEASLELHRNGTIIFRGTHIASYSSGANRIRGTTIELN